MMAKDRPNRWCRPGRGTPQRWLLTATTWASLALGVLWPGVPAGGAETWESWGTETYKLGAGESFQFRVSYEQIPVRAWRLVVEGDYVLCDLHILRLKDESLLYYQRDESRHDVMIPWGEGEEISAALTASRDGGVFTVKFLGPPPESAPASYSYNVNRALESYAVGKRLEAERLCQDALREDPHDGVARVMLAGFLRDRHFYERAAGMIDEALAGELPEDMRHLALQMKGELDRLRAPLPEGVRAGLAEAELQLSQDNPAAALAGCERMLAREDDLPPEAQSQILRCKGEALHDLERHFEAIDAFTKALTYARSREAQAAIYFRMGQLFFDMGNLAQAEGACTIARQYGLPAGLDLQAEEMLKRIEKMR
jgi:hypothetical protein